MSEFNPTENREQGESVNSENVWEKTMDYHNRLVAGAGEVYVDKSVDSQSSESDMLKESVAGEEGRNETGQVPVGNNMFLPPDEEKFLKMMSPDNTEL